MNKVFYFTTAQDQNDFKNILPLWSVSPNLSNQNFHNKLIRAIALNHEVEVISVRPINSNLKCKVLAKNIKKDGNLHWNYVKVEQNRVLKRLFLSKRINSMIHKVAHEDIVIVDTLNLSLLREAIKFAKKNHLKVVGVVTDNPRNISFTDDNYKKQLLELGQSLNGYICLTEALNNLYNHEHQPYVIIDGVTEPNTSKVTQDKVQGDYIFFGGSLMHEYGVYDLIKAFEEMKKDKIKLVICGHHEEDNFKHFIQNFNNIVYLGALDYETVNALEKGAILAVNPRPINEKIDKYSFPSKSLEYLANGVLTVAVENEILMKGYKDCIIWSHSGSVNDLKEALEKALSLDEKEVAKYKKCSKDTVKLRTSFEIINGIINQLLNVTQYRE